MNDNIRVIADKQDIVAIADAVRNKIGSTIEMSLGEIVTNINKIGSGSTVDLDAEVTAQENIITSQDALIASIASALEGKAAGGSGGMNPQTCTVNFSSTNSSISCALTTIDDSGVVSVVTLFSSSNTSVSNVLCGSSLIFNAAFVDLANYTITVNDEEVYGLEGVCGSDIVPYADIVNISAS